VHIDLSGKTGIVTGSTSGIGKATAEALAAAGATANDTRCKMCGSQLYSVVRDGAFAHVAMGTLIDDPTIRPTSHIFVGSKAPWFTITDDLPQYHEHAATAGPPTG
jgi:hypothetical protein